MHSSVVKAQQLPHVHVEDIPAIITLAKVCDILAQDRLDVVNKDGSYGVNRITQEYFHSSLKQRRKAMYRRSFVWLRCTSWNEAHPVHVVCKDVVPQHC